MATTLKTVKATPINKDIFFEGNLVQSTQTGVIYLVTVPATGYGETLSDSTFWAINLDGSFTSSGNYCKDFFKQFVGTITLEGKY